MTPEFAAAHAKWPIRELDNAWSTAPTTLRKARQLDLSGWAFYVAGRAGALGDETCPDAVAASMGAVAPDAVRAGWDAARKVGPMDVAVSRLAECARWGDEHLADMDGLGRLVDLAERVVAFADPAGMPLFAACRAMPVPHGGPGSHASLLVHLMREHAAAALLLASRTCGLSSVEALIAGPDGEEEAIALGWQPPFPPRTPVLRRFVYAQALADRISGQAYASLTAAERAELVGLLGVAADVVSSE